MLHLYIIRYIINIVNAISDKKYEKERGGEMYFVLTIILVMNLYLLKLLATNSLAFQLPSAIFYVYLLFNISLALFISIKMWKWYDKILFIFSIPIRIIDIFTWGLVLLFCLSGYQEFRSSLLEVVDFTTSHHTMELIKTMPLYFNIYSWCGLTTMGFIFIGIVRLFIKSNILH